MKQRESNQQTLPFPASSHVNIRLCRKLRNRLSQRAFRRRQAECIRELRNRVNADRRPDSERVEALQKENKILRQQLIDVQAKMSKVLASVQLLSDSVTKTLDDTKDGSHSPDEADLERHALDRKRDQHASISSMSSLDLESFDPSILDFEVPFASADAGRK